MSVSDRCSKASMEVKKPKKMRVSLADTSFLLYLCVLFWEKKEVFRRLKLSSPAP